MLPPSPRVSRKAEIAQPDTKDGYGQTDSHAEIDPPVARLVQLENARAPSRLGKFSLRTNQSSLLADVNLLFLVITGPG